MIAAGLIKDSPLISPVQEETSSRPFWSVMIPTCNPRADYFEQTLCSVLKQDPGPEQMQIVVIDDCSKDDTASEITRRIGRGRVTFEAESKHRGLVNTWNRCIERARGRWVHILHHDDVVFEGFYDRLYDGISSNPDVGMAFTRFAIIDSNDHWSRLGPLESTTAGVLDNWLDRVATGYHLECPAVVVKRATYEQLGGFTPELVCFLDVEMWVRIAVHAPVYYEPQILAGFRRHGDNVSVIQERTAENMEDMAKAIRIWKRYVPAGSRDQLERQARRYWADISLELAQQFFSSDDIAACTSQLCAAKTLWDSDQQRSRRLRLEAKVRLHRALGQPVVSAMRQFRRRIRPA